MASPVRAPISDLPPRERASGTRTVASVVELDESEDPTLRWLDRALLGDDVDAELTADPAAFVDDVARPIPEEEVTPRPTR